jgi:Fur family iron response transcriptional regulator
MREVVVEPARSYFDTNITDHHHFFHEDEGELTDIPAAALSVARLPATPDGTEVKRVDVIIRLKKS